MHRPERNVRNGFTLVELLVVIAIIGLLVALLLPAVQAARESARRMQCQNHLHQIGIALHNYHEAHRTLPPGCLEWRPWQGSPQLKNYAWSALLLPYMEQQNLSFQINFHYPFDHPINQAASVTDLPFYQCPSSRQRVAQTGRSDYGGLYGQRLTVRTPTDNGVFIHNRAIRFHEITDGLTHTIAVAEDTLGPDAQWVNGRNVFEQAGGINDPQAWLGDNEIRSDHSGGALVLFSCGRVEFLSDATEKKLLAALITRCGNEPVAE